MTAKLFPTIADLANSEFIFRIQDSGPSTIDRITIVLCDGDYLGVSQSGLGFSQWGTGIDPDVMHEKAESGEVVDLALGDLSPELQKHLLYRINEVFEDSINAGERLDPSVVAPSRDKAVQNDGIFTSAGDGIYRNEAGELFVRMSSSDNVEEDYGPFTTLREAYVATLPGSYSFSGPEYHSPIEVSALVPTPGVEEAVAALDAEVAS